MWRAEETKEETPETLSFKREKKRKSSRGEAEEGRVLLEKPKKPTVWEKSAILSNSEIGSKVLKMSTGFRN